MRKNHQLRTIIFLKFFRHRWNEVTFRKRYLHESLSNLIYNRHENHLLIIINFSQQNAMNCIKFCEELSWNFNEWTKKLMQQNQTIDDMLLQITFNNLIKKNLLKFNADWVNELMKKKNVCFAFSKVSRKIIDDILNMKTIMYVIYHCLQNDEKTFKKLKTKIWDDISKLYKDFVSSSYFSIKFNAELFSFDRCFSITIKASIFFAIENAIIDRWIWNFSTMQMKLNQLFNRNTSRSFIKKIKTNILKIIFEFLNAIKQIKKWYFKIKSFWAAKGVVVNRLISFSKINKKKKNQKSHSSQSFILRSFLHRSKNVFFDFIIFHFLKKVQIDFRLQAFRAMRRSAFIITIQNSSFHDLNEFRKARHHQLFCCIKKNVLFDKSSSPSKQLIIKNFIKK